MDKKYRRQSMTLMIRITTGISVVIILLKNGALGSFSHAQDGIYATCKNMIYVKNVAH